MTCAEILNEDKLFKLDGSSKSWSEIAADNDFILFYFSAHWCPPCRGFTPMLKDFYEDVDLSKVEIIFVSSDRSEEDMINYLKNDHGKWYYVPFGVDAVSKLKQKFQVTGIPSLVVLKNDGTLIEKNGRNDVSNKSPAEALSDWKKR